MTRYKRRYGDNDYWAIVISLSYEKNQDDLYKIESCGQCGGCFSMFDSRYDHCHSCGNTGYIKIPLPYPERPKIPDSLAEALKKAFNDWAAAEQAKQDYCI